VGFYPIRVEPQSVIALSLDIRDRAFCLCNFILMEGEIYDEIF